MAVALEEFAEVVGWELLDDVELDGDEDAPEGWPDDAPELDALPPVLEAELADDVVPDVLLEDEVLDGVVPLDDGAGGL